MKTKKLQKQQLNPHFRQYKEKIAETEKKMKNGGYQKTAKKTRELGESKRRVDDYIDQRRLEKELFFEV